MLLGSFTRHVYETSIDSSDQARLACILGTTPPWTLILSWPIHSLRLMKRSPLSPPPPVSLLDDSPSLPLLASPQLTTAERPDSMHIRSRTGKFCDLRTTWSLDPGWRARGVCARHCSRERERLDNEVPRPSLATSKRSRALRGCCRGGNFNYMYRRELDTNLADLLSERSAFGAVHRQIACRHRYHRQAHRALEHPSVFEWRG